MISKETIVNAIMPGKLRATFLVSLLFALVVAGFVHSANAQNFTIEDFHSDITISESGSIEITETIVVAFDQRKHGIYREIPFRYVNEMGDGIVMPVTVNSVLRENGRAWTYEVSKEGNVMNIRIGDADRYVQGRQVYVINYVVDNAILFFEDHDELYWNVTGNYWRAPINRASADVRLSTDEVSSEMTGACYTGDYGSNESECAYELSENKASFGTSRALRVGEGLTVAMGWDKGIVSPPSSWQKFLWVTNPGENWVFIVPLVVLIFMISHWYRKGRDPKVREAIAVMYKPPEIDGKPLTPAQVGALVDESLDQRDITSSLIGMAVRGYIELHEAEEGGSLLSGAKDFTLVRLREPDDQLSLFERTLMTDVFPGESNEAHVSDMKNKFYKKLPELQNIMFEELVSKKFFATSPIKVAGKYVLIGFGLLTIGTFLLYLLSPYAPWKGIVAGIISGFSVIGFAKAMPAKTRAGALARMNILGFQEFMNRADKDRLERMGENVFYEYLPYAIALAVVDHWVEAFKDILTEPPSWYVASAGYGAFSAHQFSQSLTVATSHLGSTMFSAPRGSGASGGGGGFSGGGGGGGGGGSW
jgi:uncharacterized membrane protein